MTVVILTQNEVEQDKQSVCFICGLTKSDLDHRAKLVSTSHSDEYTDTPVKP